MDEAAGLRLENEQLRARVAQLESELAAGDPAFLQSVLAVVPAFIIRTDPDLRVLYINQTLPDLSQDQVVGMSVYDFVAPDYVEIARTTYDRVQASREPARYSVVALGPNGQPANYDCFVAPIPEPDGRVGICVVALDVTEHLDRQRALAESESKLRVALAATGIGLWSWDLANDAVVWDARMHEITGCVEPLRVDRYIDQVVHPEDRATLAALGNSARGGAFEPSAHRLVRPDGDVRWVITAGSVLRDSHDNPVMIVGGTLDVTEARSTEDQLRQAQRMEAVGNLTAGVAHNFNNMLTAILPALQLLREVVPGTHIDLLDDATHAARRAAELVRQLMTFAGQRRQAPAGFHDLQSIVRDAADVCRRAFPPHVELEIVPGSPRLSIVGDAGGVEQVLVNVLLNARDAVIEARGPAPKITVTTRIAPEPTTAPDLLTDPRVGAEILVRDNGIGMTLGVRRRIFDPFFTTKPVNTGTGLGLATSYAIVREHGGYLQCESEAGRGTTISIWLPVGRPGSAERSTPDSPVPGPAGAKILLVDDEASVRRVVGRMLRNEGYRVVEASRGAQAVHVLEQDNDVDVILLDRSMPGGPGREFVAPLRALAPRARLLYFTGLPVSPADLEAVDGVIEKPVDPGGLFRTLCDVMGGASPSG